MNKAQYREYLQSTEWKVLRSKKLKKCKKCAICDSTQNLHVHHLRYKKIYDVNLSDLVVLCKDCHFLIHDLMKSKIRFRDKKYSQKDLMGLKNNKNLTMIKRAVMEHNLGKPAGRNFKFNYCKKQTVIKIDDGTYKFKVIIYKRKPKSKKYD